LPAVRAICAEAGIPVAGGHSIDAPEPIYGLAVVGLVHPDRVMRNSGARTGDVLILSKALGVGVISAALKGGTLAPGLERSLYDALIDSTTQLNSVGRGAGRDRRGSCDDRHHRLRPVGPHA
jgi:selenide,water dikinase